MRKRAASRPSQHGTGSAFSAQARFPAAAVQIEGEQRTFIRVGDSGGRSTDSFCPTCGATIAYVIDTWSDIIAVPLGLFEEAEFPPPVYSIYECRKLPWMSIVGPGIEHHD